MMMAMMDELYRVINDNDDNDAMLMIIMILHLRETALCGG